PVPGPHVRPERHDSDTRGSDHRQRDQGWRALVLDGDPGDGPRAHQRQYSRDSDDPGQRLIGCADRPSRRGETMTATRIRSNRRTRQVFLLVLLLALTPALAAGTAMAQLVSRTVNVNCNLGQKIGTALRRQVSGQGLVVNITGVCTENVTIVTDGVTLRAAAPGAAIHAASTDGTAVFIDGGRRVELEGLIVSGGSRAVVAFRGASVEIDTCTLEGSTINGISSSYGATTFLDNSTVRNIGSDGVLAANQGTVVVTNSTISNNGGSGVVAVRNGHIRVGLNFNSTAFGPVTISNNTSNGISIVDSSAGVVQQTISRNNSANGIFVGRG